MRRLIAAGAWVLASIAIAQEPPTPLDSPTSPTQALALSPQTALPSGWDALIADTLGDGSDVNNPSLQKWTPQQLVAAMAVRVPGIRDDVGRRRWNLAAPRVQQLHLMSIHLVDQISRNLPPNDEDLLHSVLRLEVLIESLRQSCEGENPGRARYYAREVGRVLADIRRDLPTPSPVSSSAGPASAPSPDATAPNGEDTTP